MQGIDLALDRVTGIIDLAYDRLLPHAQTLLFYTIVIEIVLLFLLYAFGRQETIADLIKKMVVISLFVWLIRDWQQLMDIVFTSAAMLGVIAGTVGNIDQNDIQNYVRPSRLIATGYDYFGTMILKIGDLFGSWSPSAILKGIVMAILFALIALIVLVGFLVGGIRVLMTTLEFHIMTALIVIMLPFAVLRATSFLAERSFAIVVSLSVKMMVTLFILTLVESILLEMLQTTAGKLDWPIVVSYLVTGILIPILLWVAPNLAAGLMSGNPTLNAGQFVASAAGMAVAGSALAVGAVAAPIAAGKATVGIGKLAAGARGASAAGSAGGGAAAAGSTGGPGASPRGPAPGGPSPRGGAGAGGPASPGPSTAREGATTSEAAGAGGAPPSGRESTSSLPRSTPVGGRAAGPGAGGSAGQPQGSPGSNPSAPPHSGSERASASATNASGSERQRGLVAQMVRRGYRAAVTARTLGAVTREPQHSSPTPKVHPDA
ncbi:type IV secretion system protein [Thalassobaculum sp.]|uniref:type IV secretion system protein n=2 Tax=Thalassobaculum sp. TaxID=2022740 RepID=UPI0032EDDB8D